MLKITICDDDVKAADQLRWEVVSFFRSEGVEDLNVSVFNSPVQMLRELNGERRDIYLLDVLMPGMNGIELGHRLRAAGDEGLIIYLTSSTEYALESYDVSAFQYLTKPVESEKLHDVLRRAVSITQEERLRGVIVRSNSGDAFLPFSQLTYAELKNRSVCYYTSDGRVIQGMTIRSAFRDACAELLRDRRFTIVGASWCVNLSLITSIDKSAVNFKGGGCLAPSRRAVEELRTKWLEYWLES